AIAGRRLIGYNMAQLYSIVTPNLTGTKLSLDSLYELALRSTTPKTTTAVVDFYRVKTTAKRGRYMA
ncbi:MAG: hypothetical protein MGG37_04560, partial [Trichodesmium sp. MAG_R01]|nr:hypothetical protein [Trichodesmium sp. MAG_R01]